MKAKVAVIGNGAWNDRLIPTAPEPRSDREPGRRRRLVALFGRDGKRIARHDLRWIVFLFVLLPLAGSGFSTLFGVLGAWALISVALLRFPWRIEPADRLIVFANLGFLMVIFLSDLHYQPLGVAAAATLGSAFFLIPLFQVSRFRLTSHDSILDAAFFGSAIGGTVLLPAVLAAYVLRDGARLKLLSGNPGPLSIVALVTLGLAFLSLKRGRGLVGNLLALTGAFGAALTVVMTGMRGAWPAIPLILLIVVFVRRGDLASLWKDARKRSRVFFVCLAALLVVGAGIFAAPAVTARIDSFEQDYGLLGAGSGQATSLNLRAQMYKAAAHAFVERPVFGWGATDMWQAIRRWLDPSIFHGISFSHLHDIFLTVAIDAGLVGLASLCLVLGAPVVTAWRWRRAPGHGDRMGFALVVTLAFLVPGLTNIMFFHDILDAAWALCMCVLCASFPPGPVPHRGRARP